MVAELDMILRLLLSAVLGAVIGYQRERAGKQAGLRTNTLICAGAIIRSGEGILAGLITAGHHLGSRRNRPGGRCRFVRGVGGGHGHNISCFAHTAFDK